MKKSNNKILYTLMMAMVLVMWQGIGSLNAQNCTSYSQAISITSCTCANNGRILVTYTGADITSRALDSISGIIWDSVNGSESDSSHAMIDDSLATSNPRKIARYPNLTGGTYRVRIRAFCNSLQSVTLLDTTLVVPEPYSYFMPNMEATNMGQPAASECKATGRIRLYQFEAPVSSCLSIKMESWPSTYTGIWANSDPSVLIMDSLRLNQLTNNRSDSGWYSVNTTSMQYIIPNLTAGAYTFHIWDTCGGGRFINNVNVASTTSSGPTNWFYSGYYAENDTTPNVCNRIGVYKYYRANNATTDPYWSIVSTACRDNFEYAIAYNDNSITGLPNDTSAWMPFNYWDTTTLGTYKQASLYNMYFPITMKYSYSECIATAAKRPIILVRPKGCPQATVYSYTVTFYNYDYLQRGTTRSTCRPDAYQTFYWYHYANTTGATTNTSYFHTRCFPYHYILTRGSSTGTVVLDEYVGKYRSMTNIFPADFQTTPGAYTLRVWDSEGNRIDSIYWNEPVTTYYYYFYFANKNAPCTDSIAPYFTGNIPGDTITYWVSKSTSPYDTLLFPVKQAIPLDYGYNTYYLFSPTHSSADGGYIPSGSVLPVGTPQLPSGYRLYVTIKDTCAGVRTISIDPWPSYRKFNSYGEWVYHASCYNSGSASSSLYQPTRPPAYTYNVAPFFKKHQLCTDSVYDYIYPVNAGTLCGAKVWYAGNKSTIPLPAGYPDTVHVPKNFVGTYYLTSKNPLLTAVNTTLQTPFGSIDTDFTSGQQFWWYILDSCGHLDSVIMVTTGYNYTNNYPRRWTNFPANVDDVFRFNKSCGKAVIGLKNNGLNPGWLQAMNTTTNAAYADNISFYWRIDSGPANANAMWSNGTSTFTGYGNNTDSVLVNADGRYKISFASGYPYWSSYLTYSQPYTWSGCTSYNSTYINITCRKTVYLDLVTPKLQLDRGTSTAFLCPKDDSKALVYAKGSNGSGNYRYYLIADGDTIDWQQPTATPDNPEAIAYFVLTHAHEGQELSIYCIDLGCGSYFTNSLTVYNLQNPTLLSIVGGSRHCIGDSVVFQSIPLGRTEYLWEKLNPSTGEPVAGNPFTSSNTIQTPWISNAQTTHSGTYRLTVQVRGCSDGIDTLVLNTHLKLSIAPRTMYWRMRPYNTDWNKPGNWLYFNQTVVMESTDAVPAPCTVVHIPSNATWYPNLSLDSTHRLFNDFGDPSCDTIIYHYGGETTHPYYLTYNAAKVQYAFGMWGNAASGIPSNPSNYETQGQPNLTARGGTAIIGATPTNPNMANWLPEERNYPGLDTETTARTTDKILMERGRWYSIAAPLQHIVGGDFGMGGHPWTGQRVFNTQAATVGAPVSGNFSSAFPKQNIELATTGNAIAVWVAPFENWSGARDHKALQAMHGVVEIPYFDNPRLRTVRDTNHLSRYSVADSTHYYLYYWDAPEGYYRPDVNNPATWVHFMPLDTVPQSLVADTLYRWGKAHEAYRFTWEKAKKMRGTAQVYEHEITVPGAVGTTTKMMVGNPFMSHIDWDKIWDYSENQNVSIKNQVFQIFGGDSQTWLYYNPLTKDNEFIAPLQAIIVDMPGGTTSKIVYPLDGTSSVFPNENLAAISYPQHRPKTVHTDPDRGYVKINAVTPPAYFSGSKNVETEAYVSFGYGSIQNQVKMIFPDDINLRAEFFSYDGDKNALGWQSFTTYQSSVPLGFVTMYTGEITLKFSYWDGLMPLSTVLLIDKELGVTHTVSDGSEYKFTADYSKAQTMEMSGQNILALFPERFELMFDFWTGMESNTAADNAVICVSKDRRLHVWASQNIASIDVRDMGGKSVMEAAGLHEKTFDRALQLSAGAYIVKVKLQNGFEKVEKVIVL